VTGDKAGTQTLQDYLKSGVVLCNLMNKIAPGTIKKINTGPAPFVQRENIENFLKGCRTVGLNETDLFVVVNLYEGSNMVTVVNCLEALGGAAQNIPTFAGPHFGKARTRLTDTPVAIGGSVNTDQIIRGTGELKAQQRTIAPSDVSSLDADIKRKLETKYDAAVAEKVKLWLEELTGTSLEGETLQEGIKSGVVLCNALNKIKPGSVKTVNMQNTPFKQMENIEHYILGCKALGMNETDLFVSQDLFEGANMALVLDNICALSGIAQNLPGYTGPQLGVKRIMLRNVPIADAEVTDSIIRSTEELKLNRTEKKEADAVNTVL